MEAGDTFELSESTWTGGASSVPAGDSTRSEDEPVRFLLPLTGSIRILDTAVQVNPTACIRQSKEQRGTFSDGRDAKRMISTGNGGGSGSMMLADVRQMQPCAEDAQSLLFSCRPRNSSVDASGSGQSVRHIRSFSLNGAKHKVFLSHSGAEKQFVEQLCVDLEARGYFFPFFDQRQHSLPYGEDFAPLIKDAARMCRVAAVVLSEGFLRSKWPMIELAEFHAAQQEGNAELKMLPVFYKVSVDELDDESIEGRWMPVWIEHACKDERIDVERWRAAVRALKRVNGPVYKAGTSEVAYRKEIVQSIRRLSRPDLLYGSCRDMAGYHRICEEVSTRFVENETVGARALGLYGMTGIGKSVLTKALCDYFDGEYGGRVCRVELDEGPRLRRVKLMVERLCGLEKDVVDQIIDVGQGMRQLREYMRREPVILAIDNMRNDDSSWMEAHEYLMAGFHSQSRVMVTSRSEDIVQELLGGVEFCVKMPGLTAEEAGAVFLSAAPLKSIVELTEEERRVVGLCIRQCLVGGRPDAEWWEAHDAGSLFPTEDYCVYCRRTDFHPMVLTALGDVFRRYFGNANMLQWRDDLDENQQDLVKDVWNSANGMGRIIGLQFSSLHPSDQLLFLDIALYTNQCDFWDPGSFWEDSGARVEWLAEMHDVSKRGLRRRLEELKRSGMIEYVHDGRHSPSVHDLYKEFAKWYVAEHGMKGVENAWGVFRSARGSLEYDCSAAELVRLRVEGDLSRAGARLVASKRMQEYDNLEVLQLDGCSSLTELNLEGLESLRQLLLTGLDKLVTVTVGGRSSRGIYKSLLWVGLCWLESLTHAPDLRSCASLQLLRVVGCPELINWEELEGPHLKVLELSWLELRQMARLPNFKPVEYFKMGINGYVDMSDVIDAMRVRELRDVEMSYLRMFEELVECLRTKCAELESEIDWDRKGWTDIWWYKSRDRSELLLWSDTLGGFMFMDSRDR